MKNLITVLFIFFSSIYFSQSEKTEAKKLCREAISQMEAGDTEAARKNLKKAIKLDPNDLTFPYEMAFTYVIDKNYKKAISILKKLKDEEDSFDQLYQMLGNCYDYNKMPKKAIETYDEGLEKFPNSGALHLERGNMEMTRKEYNNALDFYEKGIKVDPEFSSNYYWATKLYLSSSNKVYGMIYGELFMNIERNSKRTEEISKMLFDTYKNEITIKNKNEASVSFSKENTIVIDDLTDTSNFKLPFSMAVYEFDIAIAVAGNKKINLNSLANIRDNFIKYYFDNKQNEQYPNSLFDYNKIIIDEGHFEAYSYWILMKGDEKEFDKWHKKNERKWSEFINWFSENGMHIDPKNAFHSSQY